MFENTPSDRLQLVGLGELLSPANCMVCGSGVREEGYVRLGVFYDFEGEQYLCAICITQAAELIGCLTPEEAQHLQQQATVLATENAKLWEEVNDARPILDSVSKLLGITSSPGVGAGTVPAEIANIFAANGGRDLSVAPEPADAGESEPEKSVKGSDDNGVSSTTESDEKRKPRIQL